jgi:negative regulator of replication initiation
MAAAPTVRPHICMEVGDDVPSRLAKRRERAVESNYDVLRRLLDLPPEPLPMDGSFVPHECMRVAADIQGYVRQLQRLDETDSDTLRRLLRMKDPDRHRALMTLVRSVPFVGISRKTGRYLRVLEYLYEEQPADFREFALKPDSAGRVYFATREAGIKNKGSNKQRRKIRGTPPLWTLTNLNGRQMQTLIRDLLRALGYNGSARAWALRTMFQEVEERGRRKKKLR